MRFMVAEALLESQGKTLLSGAIRARIALNDARRPLLSNDSRKDRQRAPTARLRLGRGFSAFLWALPERRAAAADRFGTRWPGRRNVGSAGPDEADLRVFPNSGGGQALSSGVRQDALGRATGAGWPVRLGRGRADLRRAFETRRRPRPPGSDRQRSRTESGAAHRDAAQGRRDGRIQLD